ncbi:MAG: beta-CASP ribonuclease aCPSF1 [Candidatus Diapherotrites archaeon]|nr:beta-CASP ribonuclease aCPSF1 [Candidatus Diapherotrites archaeon]
MDIDYLKEITETIKEKLPPETLVTKVSMEGPEVAIYTKNPKAFFENENLVSSIASELKKRINIRTDKTLLSEEAEAEKKIRQIIPEDAQIKSIQFSQPFSEVVIESIKPGLVIGKGGQTSKQIVLETGWTPKIIRAPIAESKILQGIRYHFIKNSAEVKKFLEETAQKIYGEKPSENGWIRLTALGGFREVGRSCVYVETKKTRVLLDCGINIASKENAYPYLEALRFPLNELNAVIVSHAHLDHSGMIPFLFKMGYTGPVYCTEPTRDLMALLQFDLIDVMVKDGKEPPYTERDIREMVKHCITRDYREVTDIAPDMRLTFHDAAHILGSCSVHLNMGQGAHNLVYSGDIKYGFTRLFNNVEMKFSRLETLIIESTYGGKTDIQPQRQDTEEKFLKTMIDVLKSGGNILIPVFAVGRAQELMLVIENFYRRGFLPAETKLFVDGMTKEASAIHTAYPEYLRKAVQKRVLQNDSPFTSDLFQTADFQNRDEIAKGKSSIIIASSGMLTGGPSVHYFQAMAEDPQNAIFFVGWQGEGSLGRKIQNGISELTIMDEKGKAKTLKINLKVEIFEGFSGHSDRSQLVKFVSSMNPLPKRILVNHGERTKSSDLAKYLNMKFHVSSSSLNDLDSVRLR